MIFKSADGKAFSRIRFIRVSNAYFVKASTILPDHTADSMEFRYEADQEAEAIKFAQEWTK
jgi:hypothetical protein